MGAGSKRDMKSLVAREVERAQFGRLSRLLAYVYGSSAYYRRRFDALGIDPSKLHTLADFQHAVPLMTKEDVLQDQFANPPFGERQCVATEDLIQVNITGGTSGRGQEVYGLTSQDVSVLSSLYARGLHNAGARAGDVVALTFPMSMSGAALWIYEACRGFGLNVLCLGSYDTRAKLQAIVQFGARILIATPSYLRAMSYTAESDLGWELRSLPIDILLTATEAYSAEWARSTEVRWGARLFEWYGSTQRVMAWSCDRGVVHPDGARGLLHHFPYLALYETLDPATGDPVDYGEEGEVVITFLEVQGTPLMRFATGDRARLLPASSCGCNGVYDGYEAGQIRRYDDMMKVRGVNFWPWMVDDVLFASKSVKNYAGCVRTGARDREEIAIEIEWNADVSGETRVQLATDLSEAIAAVIGLHVDVVESLTPLPQFEDPRSKARRWRDDREH